jgi:glutamine amidotransferase
MIVIIDYGLGNVLAFANIYQRLGVPCRVARCCRDLDGASRLILPGVGAFDWAISLLNASGMREKLEELVLRRGTPVLGVCVGMQIMADSSEEGALPGLGWIPGRVTSFRSRVGGANVRLPHMGWNGIERLRSNPILLELDSSRYYFLHSFYFSCADPENVLGVTDYHGAFASMVNKKNIFGTQFHPEKSHGWGTRLLRNFGEIKSC